MSSNQPVIPILGKPITRQAARLAAVERFTRKRYGIRGTLALHREAIGLDLLRAPINVMLSPIFLLMRVFAFLLTKLGAKRAGTWLGARQIFLKSSVAQRIQTDLTHLIEDLDAKGIGPNAAPALRDEAVASHAETRNAVAEITTSLIVLVGGYLLFDRATPGIISIVGPLAEMRAHSSAVEDFLLGNGMGRLWYWAFPVELSPWQVIATGLVLALLASLVTTFAGLIADPVQLWTGTHRRRTMRLLAQLDNAAAGGIEREHLLARMGDLSDLALMLWRSMR